MDKITIHPTAIVSSQARINDGVSIGPYAIIESDVEIGSNTEIRSNVYLVNGTKIGNNCKIHSFAVIGTEPQDLKFKGEKTEVIIGDNNVIREFVTINRGTNSTGKTILGNNCLIMTYTHIAHDCHLGNNIIIANATQLAGHVEIEDFVTIGGVVKIHQFSKIGCYSMIGADVKIVKDVPPYVLIGREPAQIKGVNKIGLKRNCIPQETIKIIEEFYDILLYSGLNNRDGIAKYRERSDIQTEIQHCINFIENSSRGIYR